MNTYIWTIIIGGAIVTILPRILPVMFISKINLNDRISKFLKFIPIAILSTLVVSELFIVNNKVSINTHEAVAVIPTVIVAIKKNNLLLTVMVGVISLALLRMIFN